MRKFILDLIYCFLIGFGASFFIGIVSVSAMSPKKVAFSAAMKAIRDEQKDWIVID